jgi:CheY-like chemotaxis protein
LERARESRDAAVICDIAMPVLDGCEFLRRFRELESRTGWFTPAIAPSAFAEHDAETQALNAGFHRVVAKPLDFTALVVAVAEASSGGVA